MIINYLLADEGVYTSHACTEDKIKLKITEKSNKIVDKKVKPLRIKTFFQLYTKNKNKYILLKITNKKKREMLFDSKKKVPGS